MSRDIRNIEWRESDEGRYWIGELWRDGKKVGYTGNYYFRECPECMPPEEAVLRLPIEAETGMKG